MIRALYAIRHQIAGIITEKTYAAEPTPEEVERVRRAHTPPGRNAWARVVLIPVEFPPELCDVALRFPAVPEPPALERVEEPLSVPRFVFHATGVVTPPR